MGDVRVSRCVRGVCLYIELLRICTSQHSRKCIHDKGEPWNGETTLLTAFALCAHGVY